MEYGIWYWSAFLFGLLGSTHCIGMCGPLVVVLPWHRERFWLEQGLHALGRITTYATLGLLVGVLGKGITLALPQQWLTIFAGLTIVAIVAARWTGQRYRFELPGISSLLRRIWARVLNRPGLMNFYFVGLLNGLLPCGFVYVALISSVAIGGLLQTVLYMASFGLGTVPLLAVATLFGTRLRGRAYQRLLPAFSLVVAGLLILRGLNLGVPYLSPAADAAPLEQQAADLRCH